MLHNLRIHQKFVAILLLPLVVLTVLAVGRIRSNITQSVRAGRVNNAGHLHGHARRPGA